MNTESPKGIGAKALRLRPSAVAVIVLVAAILFVGAIARPAAHDIPADVLVQAFVKPEGSRLRVLVRVPLGAMRDVSLPMHGQGFLNLPVPDALLGDAARLWIAGGMTLDEGDRPLDASAIVAARVSLPSDRSFASYEDALAHVTGAPLAADTELPWNQAMLDVLFEYPIASDRSDFSIHPSLARLGLRVVTVLRFLPPGGAVRAFEYTGDPGLVRLDPRWHQAALRFVELGFDHILSGVDHLLFLFCLVIPFRRFGQLVLVVTSFTVAHSITLIASAFNLAPDALWFPPLIETLIAVSIVYMALENIVGVTSVHRRWMITFAFGLVHGFGFSFALRETLQFAGSHLVTSLLSFNLGVELGQLLVLALFIPALTWLFRRVVAERMGTIILSALVAHTAWHWMIDRADRLRQFSWPTPDAAGLAMVLRWGIAALVLGGALGLARGLLRAKRRGLR
jgi:hypothetical protein